MAFRDKLRVISTAAESEEIATAVDDTGGVYFVPFFFFLRSSDWAHRTGMPLREARSPV